MDNPFNYYEDIYFNAAVFYDLPNDIINYYYDANRLINEGYKVLEAKINADPQDVYYIISEASDNGTAIDASVDFIPMYDDGNHYDFNANDGKYKIRFRNPNDVNYFNSSSNIQIKVEDPFGNVFYDTDEAYPIFLPDIYDSTRISSASLYLETDDQDENLDPGEDIHIYFDQNDYSTTRVYIVGCFEQQTNQIDFTASGSILRDVFFNKQAICYDLNDNRAMDLSTNTSPLILPGNDNLFNIYRSMGYNQVRIIFVDMNGDWAVSSNSLSF